MARKPRDYKAEYAARKARGRAAGKTAAEAIGKPDRDYSREYRDRVAREVAAGKRKPPRARPRNNQAPTGVPLQGARRFDGTNSPEAAEATLNRLRSDRTVFVYVRARVGGKPSEDFQLWPKGGIRASTLRQLVNEWGTLREALSFEVRSERARAGSDPAVNPANRRGKSGRFEIDGPDGARAAVEFDHVVLQWT